MYKFKHIRFKWHEDRWGQIFWVAFRKEPKRPVPTIIASGNPKLTTRTAGYSLSHLMPMFQELDMMYEEKKRQNLSGK